MALFPDSIVIPVIDAMKRNLPGNSVVARRLGASEGHDTIGVFPATWRPDEQSLMIGATERLSAEPTLNYYAIRIQNLRIDSDEEAGRAAFNLTAKKIRAILYRDPELHVALRSLTEELLGTVERMKKMEVVKQDYLDSLTGYGMYFLCTTEIVFTTESTPVA